MNILLQNLMRRFMDETDDGSGTGAGAGGGASADRGDNLEQSASNESSGGAATDDTDTDTDGQPRAKDGKFAKKDRGEVGIPKARFDEAVNKEREAREAAERRAADAEARLKQESKSDQVKALEEKVDGLEKQHAKLILDGEHEKAATVMRDIRLTERSIARMENEDKTSTATAQAVEQVRVEAAVAKLQADHPQFNEDSELFDQELVDLVLAKQGQLIQSQRMSPSKALLEAGKLIAKRFIDSSERNGSGATKGLAAAAKGDDRKATQVAKNLDTDKRQPAAMKDVGLDSDKGGSGSAVPSTANMTRDEWEALPAATKAKLRGDSL